jgi:hypothetical protein
MLRDTRVGQKIFTIRDGWTKVTNIYPERVYSIRVESCSLYTLEGKYSESDLHPSAWTYNPFDPEDKPPCEFKVGEVIAVSANKKCWWYATFIGMDGELYMTTYRADKYARKLTSEERGE